MLGRRVREQRQELLPRLQATQLSDKYAPPSLEIGSARRRIHQRLWAASLFAVTKSRRDGGLPVRTIPLRPSRCLVLSKLPGGLSQE